MCCRQFPSFPSPSLDPWRAHSPSTQTARPGAPTPAWRPATRSSSGNRWQPPRWAPPASLKSWPVRHKGRSPNQKPIRQSVNWPLKSLISWSPKDRNSKSQSKHEKHVLQNMFYMTAGGPTDFTPFVATWAKKIVRYQSRMSYQNAL